jgi:hypothetical protein
MHFCALLFNAVVAYRVYRVLQFLCVAVGHVFQCAIFALHAERLDSIQNLTYSGIIALCRVRVRHDGFIRIFYFECFCRHFADSIFYLFSSTAMRLRPALRLRFSTTRPPRVDMRARNPCFLTRLFFDG